VKKIEQIHGDTKVVGTRTRATFTAYTAPTSSCVQQRPSMSYHDTCTVWDKINLAFLNTTTLFPNWAKERNMKQLFSCLDKREQQEAYLANSELTNSRDQHLTPAH